MSKRANLPLTVKGKRGSNYVEARKNNLVNADVYSGRYGISFDYTHYDDVRKPFNAGAALRRSFAWLWYKTPTIICDALDGWGNI